MTDNLPEIFPPSERRQLRAGHAIVPIIPSSMEEALEYAHAVIAAGLAPDSYNKGGNGADRDQPDPQKVMIGIMKSLEVGFPPITGLSVIAIINRRAVIWGDGAIALVQSKGLVEKIEEVWTGSETATRNDISQADFPDGYSCTYRIWRRGQPNPYEGTFSVRDAKRSHLWANPKRQPWCLYPKRMLLARARAFALRDGFADALAGLGIREEVEDLPPEAPQRTDVSFLDDAPPAAQWAIAAPTEEPIPFEQPSEPATAAPPLAAAVAPAADLAPTPQGVSGGGSDSSDPKIHAKWVTWGTKATEAVFNSHTVDDLEAAYKKIDEKIFEYRQHIGDQKANDLVNYVEERRLELTGEKDGG